MHFQKPMLGVPLDWSNPLNKDLVMHLAMNEGYGDVVRDMSMNGNHGKMHNFAFPPTAASGWNPGQTGRGLNFDGTNDYIDCGNNASLDISDEITISLWAKPIIDTGLGYLIIKNLSWSGDAQYGILWNSGKVVYYPTHSLFSDAGSVRAGTWTHIIFTRTGTTGQFYTNGIASGSPTACDMPSTNFTINIGRRKTSSNYFVGSIDQVRIYNRALTAKEVEDYYINPWQVYLDEEGM